MENCKEKEKWTIEKSIFSQVYLLFWVYHKFLVIFFTEVSRRVSSKIYWVEIHLRRVRLRVCGHAPLILSKHWNFPLTHTRKSSESQLRNLDLECSLLLENRVQTSWESSKIYQDCFCCQRMKVRGTFWWHLWRFAESMDDYNRFTHSKSIFWVYLRN